jgi:hypothetical protein
MRKSTTGLMVLASSTFMAGGVALGGQRWDGGDVHVGPVGRWAFGNLGGARNMADMQQYVRRGDFADGWAIASCQLVDNNGTHGARFTLDPEVMQIAVTSSARGPQ